MILHTFKYIPHQIYTTLLSIYCPVGKGTKEALPCPDKVNREFHEVCLYSNILYQTLGSVPINVKFLLRVPYIFYC